MLQIHTCFEDRKSTKAHETVRKRKNRFVRLTNALADYVAFMARACPSNRKLGVATRAIFAEILGADELDLALKVFVVDGLKNKELAEEIENVHPGSAHVWRERFRRRLGRRILTVAWRSPFRRDKVSRKAARMLARLKTILIAEAVGRAIAEDDGCTVDPRTAEVVQPIDAWCVGIAGTEETHEERPSVESIARYVESHAAALDKRGRRQGAWFDAERGVWCLEISVVIRDLARALALAATQSQRRIYNLETRGGIRVAWPGEGAA
jgi:hypothetical protein